jgi:pimeloyl-ACP methyl ester carboxylesterase
MLFSAVIWIGWFFRNSNASSRDSSTVIRACFRLSSLVRLSNEFQPLARFFVQRGWAVIMPSRRGRGGSEEYDEGFGIDRSRGYTCDPSLSMPGADRALRDIEAAMGAILTMPFVDPSRVVIGGVSRGGILSVAYAGQHPEQVKGVINFVGGWLGYAAKPSVPSIRRFSGAVLVIQARRSGSMATGINSTHCSTAVRTSPHSRRLAARAYSMSLLRLRDWVVTQSQHVPNFGRLSSTHTSNFKVWWTTSDEHTMDNIEKKGTF